MAKLLRGSEDTSLGPLLPESYDLIWPLMVAALVLLVVAAIVRILRSSGLTGASRVVWLLLVLLTPPIGAIAALLLVAPAPRTAKAEG